MSEAFKEILLNSPKSTMNTIHMIAFIAVLVIPVFTRKFWYSLAINTIILISCYFLIISTFYNWWNTLKLNSQNEQDKLWLANHDGGGFIIVELRSMFLLLCSWVISVILAYILAKRFQNELREKGIVED